MLTVIIVKKYLNIKISDSALIYIAAMVVCVDLELIVPLFLAVIIHEIGHILAIKMLGGEIYCLTICAGGVKITYNSTAFTYFKDVVCALAGPMFGVMSALVASYFGFSIFSGVSLCINVFNLLPIRPLDGGNVLRNIFVIISNNYAATYINIIEIVMLLLLFCVSVYVLITYQKFSLLLITGVLTFCYCKER